MNSQPDLKPFLACANKMADASGEVIRKYFRTPFVVQGKSDASPVTIADKESEQALREIIMRERPDDGIWGEEFGSSNLDADFVWVLDPIDGTRAFAIGKPTFGTLIGLLYKGMPVLGIIDQPISGERWCGADGIGSTFNGKPAHTRRCAAIEDAVAVLSPHPFPDGDGHELPPYRALSKKVRTTSVTGDCYVYGLLASGFADIVLENDLKLHDFAAIVPIVKNAGGQMTDWKGKPLGLGSKGDILACGDARLAIAVMDMLGDYL